MIKDRSGPAAGVAIEPLAKLPSGSLARCSRNQRRYFSSAATLPISLWQRPASGVCRRTWPNRRYNRFAPTHILTSERNATSRRPIRQSSDSNSASSGASAALWFVYDETVHADPADVLDLSCPSSIAILPARERELLHWPF